MYLPKQFLAGLAALALVATACGNSEEVESLAPAAAAAEVDQTFAAAPPELKQAADAASSALRANEYEKALVAIHAISASQNTTPDQQRAAVRSMESLQGQLARALVNGDTNAMRIIQMIQASRGR